MKKEHIVSYTLDEIKKMKGNTDWDRFDKITDEDIDYSDIPELTDEFWENARKFTPVNKKQVSLRIDADVLKWFKSLGKGYQSHMNAVLKAYAETHS